MNKRDKIIKKSKGVKIMNFLRDVIVVVISLAKF